MMADFVFNICKGAFVEKFRDGAANGGILLLTAMEVDATARDHNDLAAFIGAVGNTEASDVSYARKTALTGTITVDDTNDRVDVDLPDQTFVALAGTAITDLVVFYDEGATEATRIPISAHDFVLSPDSSDVTAVFNAAGFARAL